MEKSAVRCMVMTSLNCFVALMTLALVLVLGFKKQMNVMQDTKNLSDISPEYVMINLLIVCAAWLSSWSLTSGIRHILWHTKKAKDVAKEQYHS